MAGPAAAITLARAGRRVILLEREREPKHKVCGEFLSAEALALLGSLGVSPLALGAVAVRGVRLCAKQSVTEADLPFPAMSLTRRQLDPALLCAAEAAGVTVERGIAVKTLTKNGDGWHVGRSEGGDLTAGDVVLATGKHDLRGFVRPPGPQSDLVGMKMYWRLGQEQTAALTGHVELLLHRGGYTGLELVEGGAANLCCLVQRKVLTQIGGWDGLLALVRESSPHARERLAGADPLLPKPLAISGIPYGFVRRQAAGPRLWAVGDQAAVIPSFTGDGMSIALYSGVRAAESLLAGQTAEVYQRDLHATVRPQVGRATALSRALLYGVVRQVLATTAPLWPPALRWAATATRLPSTALAGVRVAQ